MFKETIFRISSTFAWAMVYVYLAELLFSNMFWILQQTMTYASYNQTLIERAREREEESSKKRTEESEKARKWIEYGWVRNSLVAHGVEQHHKLFYVRRTLIKKV